MRNEFNNPVKTYQGGEDYSEVICFNYDKKTEEFSNETDLYVTAEIIDFDEDNLTAEQIDQVYAFAEEIQQEIRNTAFEFQNMKRTEQWLSANYN
ncbi:MAG: hypothetical protein LC112_10965 [Flavobacteriales bacterium]|nr:hypothetical protein [Flavobacteriales bacterium]